MIESATEILQPSDDEEERDPAMKDHVTKAGHAWREKNKLPVGSDLTPEQEVRAARGMRTRRCS